jgi:redox-sensitive bicupin YhaK (pirin superfamily)
VHLFQIWILPEARGLKPSYEQTTFTAEEKKNRLRLIGSRDARDGSVTIHQDVDLYASILEKGKTVSMALRPGRGIWVQVLTGSVRANGVELGAGDAAAIENASELSIEGVDQAELLVFDLA